MTKAQLHKIVDMNNRNIRSQLDMRVSALVFDLVHKVCKVEKWDTAEFFREGGEGNELQSTPPEPVTGS
jgi:hypothetical protein